MTGFLFTSVFLFFAALAAAGGIITVFRRDAVASAVGLLAALLGVAGLFGLLSAHMLAVVQILVYAGAVMVLIVFSIFLIDASRRRPVEFGGLLMKVLGPAAAAAMLVKLSSLAVSGRPGAPSCAAGAGYGTAESAGELLFGRYVVHFELVSFVLLAAMIGAVVLAKRRAR
jgi:NADH-quinone oxidoreductase subunit J